MSEIIKIIKCTAACFGNMYILIQMRVKPCAQKSKPTTATAAAAAAEHFLSSPA